MSLQKLALELAGLEKLKLEMQKEMERIAIRSIVNSTQSKVKASGQQIQSKMHSSMDEVKQFASQSMVASITPIFAGKQPILQKTNWLQYRCQVFQIL